VRAEGLRVPKAGSTVLKKKFKDLDSEPAVEMLLELNIASGFGTLCRPLVSEVVQLIIAPTSSLRVGKGKVVMSAGPGDFSGCLLTMLDLNQLKSARLLTFGLAL
jgi:hypothetical protein